MLARGCCSFMHEAAKQLIGFKDYITPVISYLLEIFLRFQNLQTLALNTIFEIGLYCKAQMKEADFNMLFNFLSSNY